jgi:hypothetical protein
MSNFAYLFESMDRYKKDNKEYIDSQSMEAIRNGMNLREDFWQDFIAVTNNAEALSALLGIPAIKISKWNGKVKKYLTKYYEEEGEQVDLKKKRKFINTSDFYS